jgi:hypothetical protein
MIALDDGSDCRGRVTKSSLRHDLYRKTTTEHCTLTGNRRRQKPFSGDKDAERVMVKTKIIFADANDGRDRFRGFRTTNPSRRVD